MDFSFSEEQGMLRDLARVAGRILLLRVVAGEQEVVAVVQAQIARVLLKLTEKASGRIRKHRLLASRITLTIRYKDFHTFTRTKKLPNPTNDTATATHFARAMLNAIELKQPVRLIGISLGALVEDPAQLELFGEVEERNNLLKAMDAVNARYGGETLTWGAIEERKETGVISPSWRPTGIKKINVR